ncbi:MAG: Ku protein [Candidatus Sumerlaeota bacterium]
MARPVWKGTISFGLVSIPVTLYSAEISSDLRFNLLDSRDKAKVRYERLNEVTGEEVPWNNIVKGYEYEKGHYVLMRDEDFKRAAVEATKTVEIEDFVDEGDIPSVYFDKPYFLIPGKGGDKGYALLREAMRDSKKVGVAKVVIRSRQYLAAVKTWNDVIVLNLMRFAQEIQDPADYEVPGDNLKSLKIAPREVALAKQLVESMSGKWKPEQYKDEYRGALMDWIKKKIKAGQLDKPLEVEEQEEEEKPSSKVVDVMSLLQQSLTHRKEGRGKKTTAKAKVEKVTTKKKAPAKRAEKESPRKKIARAS